MGRVVLKPGKEAKLRNFYPWVYADELKWVEPGIRPGEVVQVEDARGSAVGRAFFNSFSHIPARMLTLDPEESIDRGFLEGRLLSAGRRREGSIAKTNAMRLVHAEADGLPGLVVDRFGEVLVMQLRNPGMEKLSNEIIRLLRQLFTPQGIFERSDVQAREEEGMERRAGLTYGQVPDKIEIYEDDLRYELDVRMGQKTGFYLDQRDNRRAFRALVVPGARVLDVYSYSGAFSLNAARMGAQALAVDKDAGALQLLETNARLNGVGNRIGARFGDAQQVLDNLKREGRRFDFIVLDPPTLAKHKNDVPRVKQLLIQIIGQAFSVLDPGGILFASTCAYHISSDDLIECGRRAANESHRRCQVQALTYQPADHPWILQVPETLYLKTLVLRADS
jgi:23S rRNA (cytosine1962-C5)-methyltransferase